MLLISGGSVLQTVDCSPVRLGDCSLSRVVVSLSNQSQEAVNVLPAVVLKRSIGAVHVLPVAKSSLYVLVDSTCEWLSVAERVSACCWSFALHHVDELRSGLKLYGLLRYR